MRDCVCQSRCTDKGDLLIHIHSTRATESVGVSFWNWSKLTMFVFEVDVVPRILTVEGGLIGRL